MRKICYVCDRCGCEIDGNAAGIEIKQKNSRGYEDEADLIDVSALFADKAERQQIEGALSWDICGECLAAVLRTLIKAGTPRIKCNLPDVGVIPKKKGRPRKTVERKLDQMEDEREGKG